MTLNSFRVQMLAAKKCMNMAELAVVSGMAPSTLRLAVAGHSVTLKTLGKIAKALGVEPEDIVERED